MFAAEGSPLPSALRAQQPPTALAFCQLGAQGYAVHAQQVRSIVEAPSADEPCLDLIQRLGLPAQPFATRMALQLHGCETLLLVGASVQVEPVPANALEPLPMFLQGLKQRAFLHGWVHHREQLYYLLELQGLMRGCI